MQSQAKLQSAPMTSAAILGPLEKAGYHYNNTSITPHANTQAMHWGRLLSCGRTLVVCHGTLWGSRDGIDIYCVGQHVHLVVLLCMGRHVQGISQGVALLEGVAWSTLKCAQMKTQAFALQSQ